jgi:hypothetical protein
MVVMVIIKLSEDLGVTNIEFSIKHRESHYPRNEELEDITDPPKVTVDLVAACRSISGS